MAKTNDSEELKEIRKSAMTLFSKPEESLADKLRAEILPSIITSGTTTRTVEHKIGKDAVDTGSGKTRLKRGWAEKFSLILSHPKEIDHISALTLRCALCHKVVSYPIWYHNIKYAVNHFHYFICFDSSSPNKPSTKCYKRG